MTRKLPGPERKHLLEVYIKCIKRAENRIKRKHKLHPLRMRNVAGYTLAFQALRIKRSEFAAELAGLPWEAKPFKPLSQHRPPQPDSRAENSSSSISREPTSTNSSPCPPPKTGE